MKCLELSMLYSSCQNSAIQSAPSIAAAGRFGTLGRILADRLNAYLARGVDNLGRKVLSAVSDHFAESVLDGGIVAVYEMAVHELHRE